MADINTNKIINFGNLSQYHTNLKNWITYTEGEDNKSSLLLAGGANSNGIILQYTPDDGYYWIPNNDSEKLSIGVPNTLTSLTIDSNSGQVTLGGEGNYITLEQGIITMTSSGSIALSPGDGNSILFPGLEFSASGNTGVIQQGNGAKILQVGDSANSAYFTLGEGKIALYTDTADGINPVTWNGKSLATTDDIYIKSIGDITIEATNGTETLVNDLFTVANHALKAKFDFTTTEDKYLALNGVKILDLTGLNDLPYLLYTGTSLPIVQTEDVAAEYINKILLWKNPDDTDNNIYTEYVLVQENGRYYWELFGTASIDFTYATNDDINSLFA